MPHDLAVYCQAALTVKSGVPVQSASAAGATQTCCDSADCHPITLGSAQLHDRREMFALLLPTASRQS